MRIHHNKTFDCYEDCEQDINAFGKEIFLDGHKLYTKADIVAMLEELKKEIIELPFPQREPEYMQGYSYCQTNILDYVIQQKINTLKGEENGKID